MGLFDRFFRRPLQPGTTRQRVDAASGPLTAREAWDVVRPHARALDPGARLVLLTSDLNIDPAGRAHGWEFGFDLPGRDAVAMISLGSEAEDPDGECVELVQRVSGAPDRERRPALSEAFRDSPEVVSEFTSRGVDFVAGPTDMKLEARVTPGGQAEWVTWGWDGEVTTAFVA